MNLYTSIKNEIKANLSVSANAKKVFIFTYVFNIKNAADYYIAYSQRITCNQPLRNLQKLAPY